jgi:hydroxymethylpyrimidine/phosphomethylpyrimidine kinase
MIPVALTIAGSDPSGGAGIQADLKTFHRFGVYGQAVITLLTVQNTQRVSLVETVRPELVAAQIRAVLEDIPPQAAKLGALGSRAVIEAVAELIPTLPCPLVVDPVAVSKHGAPLLALDALEALKELILPAAFLVTPNIPEAEALTGLEITDDHHMAAAGQAILAQGCQAVLIKGGHLAGPPTDLLVTSTMTRAYAGTRIETRHTHGTGCTYSAAITAGLAKGLSLEDAIARAKAFVQRAIETAPQLGAGFGPLNHFA